MISTIRGSLQSLTSRCTTPQPVFSCLTNMYPRSRLHGLCKQGCVQPMTNTYDTFPCVTNKERCGFGVSILFFVSCLFAHLPLVVNPSLLFANRRAKQPNLVCCAAHIYPCYKIIVTCQQCGIFCLGATKGPGEKRKSPREATL